MFAPGTPKSNTATPRTANRRHIEAPPPATPECFTNVTVETPRSSKKRTSKNKKCDEIRNLNVAVRVRPMNTRELNTVGTINVVEVQDQTVVVRSNPSNCAVTKADYFFSYDHVFWSCDETSPRYSTQEDVFVGIGEPLIDSAFRGYNACLFAYGQTGSGKSYSMMGPDVHSIDCMINGGIIPRFCHELFERISRLDNSWSATIDVSYFEIYNEKIHDLLVTNNSRDQQMSLKVREHPDWGPYVVNLNTHTVKTYEEIRYWLLLGYENRATTATTMNEKSSRSHSIFSVELSILEGSDKSDPGRRSKVSLVDLAGSERLGNIGTKDEKLKQGVSINKSLLTLGKVINALAEQRKGSQFVPYRDSVLTWLLRESLGGNSLTCMLATITPASTHLDETLATLRYACRARSIVNRARINEQPHDRLIRELRSEVERLRALSHEYEKSASLSCSLQIDNSTEYLQELEELKKKLNEKEKELECAQESWENRYKEAYLHQLQQLAEVRKEKEQLESHVRVMSNLVEDVNLSPYRTNFLEEVENLLTENVENPPLIIYSKLQEQVNNYDCKESKINTSMKEAVFKKEEICESNLNCINDENLTEEQVHSSMNEIFNVAKFLQPYINKEEKLRLAFAKFIKSAQALETVLSNTMYANKSKKAVTFRL